MIKPISVNEAGKTILAMGNEAVVRGALEAGIGYFSTYPGTPASEIGEVFSELSPVFPHIHTEFSVNEHVAAHGAQGASWANIRSMVTMKHVGMNVASEVLHFSAYTGVGAGFVIVIGSDPGATSSTSEQDDRWYSLHTHLPILEPSTIQEAKDYTLKAFLISEKYNLPVIINTPSKLCHNIGSLQLGNLPENIKPFGYFKKNPERYLNLFGTAVLNHRKALESVKKLTDEIPVLGLNKVLTGTGKTGFISSSVNYLYLLEALSILGINDCPVFKFGISYPVNPVEIINFAKDLERIYIAEDLEGFLEFQVKKCLYDSGTRIPVTGKKLLPEWGELDVDIIVNALKDELKLKFPSSTKRALELSDKLTKDIPPRQGSFCTGCPHRATLYSIVKSTDRKAIFAGDIGCYTLSMLPPFKAFDWVTCMNCGAGIAQGMGHKLESGDILAYVGDSTFFHSGIPNLINAVQQNSDFLLVIMDNKWVAMTGHQPSPTTSSTITGKEIEPVDINGLLKSIGIKYIRRINPFNIKTSIIALKDALKQRGVRVIISEKECALQSERRKKYFPPEYEVYYQIEPGRCQKCNECYIHFGCPAIRRDNYQDNFHYYIEEASCTRCGACHDLCPNSAIQKTEILREKRTG